MLRSRISDELRVDFLALASPHGEGDLVICLRKTPGSIVQNWNLWEERSKKFAKSVRLQAQKTFQNEEGRFPVVTPI